MASASRRARKGPKDTKMVMQGKVSPERFRYCIDHDIKMYAVQAWPGKTMQFRCKEGCRMSKGEAILK